MFVDVVAMLVVPVTIMDVVLVITVLHDLAAVPVRVGAFVVDVCRLLSMTLVAVQVVEMVVVFDGFATVSGQVFMVSCFGVPHRHAEFLPAAVSVSASTMLPGADCRKPSPAPGA